MFDFSTKADRKEAAVFLGIVWEGLEYLCEQVEQEETERVAKTGKNFGYTDFGSQPGDALVCNYFLWYASALYNFIGIFQSPRIWRTSSLTSSCGEIRSRRI